MKNISFDQKLIDANVEISELRLQNAKLLEQRDKLYNQLSNYSGIKAQLKSLLHTIHDRMNRKVEFFGHVNRVRTIRFKNKNIQNIDCELFLYDKKALSQSRIFGSLVRRSLYQLSKFTIAFAVNIGRALLKNNLQAEKII